MDALTPKAGVGGQRSAGASPFKSGEASRFGRGETVGETLANYLVSHPGGLVKHGETCALAAPTTQ